ncbi:MAG TPA: efflux RND transporter permease subunit [Drouetiella sp.]
MWLIRLALTRPITIMVIVAATVLFSVLAITRMKIDIFPTLDLPRITVIQPYGGMDPAQMEGYMVTFYEQHFFYISGVDHVSSRSIQGASVMDVYFQPNSDMADAMSQVVAQVERSKSYMPPGTVAPFILRFDVGNVPVGFLTFSSKTRDVGEIQDLVYSRVRPIVSTIPGVSTPPPFGGNQRSIVVSVDAEKLNQYHLSVDDIVNSLDKGNTIVPSGIVRIAGLQRVSEVNSVVGDIQDLGTIPIKTNEGVSVYLRDVAKIEDTTDILTGYALVNGRRTVYMAISKQASASTLAVVDGVKKNISYMQSQLPDDIHVGFEFDQSVYVTEAIEGLLFEGALGAILTGGVVLVFLGDLRSSCVVVMSIPFALLSAVVGLWINNQTINIMTLSGLALAIGILVDEATVVIENIHSHIQRGKNLKLAIYDASVEVAVPTLLAMLSVISVFMPSFFMTGVTRSLFVPLSLAVGLAMFSSYMLSRTFVPVMCNWILKPHPHDPDHVHETFIDKFMNKLRKRYQRILIRFVGVKYVVLTVFILAGLSAALIFSQLGNEIFPAGNPTGFQLRIKAPTGTRFERTEVIAKDILATISDDVGADNVEVTIGYVGSQPPAYAISNLYMWTSGPQEAVLLVSFKKEAKISIRGIEEKLRGQIAQKFPDVKYTFEAGDIVNKILNFGASTPLQVDINGPNFKRDQEYAKKLLDEMTAIKSLRDVGILQPLDYPTINIDIDRVRAGELGVNVSQVSHALVASTYSSRFVTPVFWRDGKSGLAYQVQVQVPQGDISSLKDIGSIPAHTGSYSGPFVRDVAKLHYGVMPGEYDHYNMSRVISITANLSNDDLGAATRLVQQAIDKVGKPPKGVRVTIRGQVPIMGETFQSLALGVAFAIVSIFLLLLSFFQSFKLAFSIISVIPAIMFGAMAALFVSHTTMNVQSFMGTIMSTGVGVANSILVCVFAESKRMTGMSAKSAAITGAGARLRPVMMTSIAMISGMIPMALGLGEGGERTAPLGRAVIGGLLCSTTAVLFVLPIIYSMIQKKTGRRGPSLLPEDDEAPTETVVENREYVEQHG